MNEMLLYIWNGRHKRQADITVLFEYTFYTNASKKKVHVTKHHNAL